jgi:uncharacterized protein
MAAKRPCLQRLAIALASAGAVAALALAAAPASAQFGNFRRGGIFDSFWGPFQAPRQSTEPRVDASRAPAPQRRETPATTTVLVLGDSMADWLAYGLEDALADTPEIGVVRRHRTNSGLIRYDGRNENADWAQGTREAIAATKPKYIIMMVGLNDRQSIRVRQQPSGSSQPTTPQTATPAVPQAAAPSSPDPAETPAPEPSVVAPEPQGRAVYHLYDFRSDQWAEHYGRRIEAVIAALKTANVPVFWVGLPSIRGPKSTGDMQYLDDLYRERVEKAGLNYIDVWDGFVDDSGRYSPQGPDLEGQIRRLRAGDGVHFTKAGARKLAHYVERELRRMMTRGVTTVALPSTEPTQAPAQRPGQPNQRPLSGPVLPLTVATSGQQDLAGGGAPSAPTGQPIVTRVLVKGEALTPPAGRSDDFAWPRRDIAPFGTDPVVATTTDPIPVMQAAPAATTVPVPSEETRPVAAAAPRRAAPRPQVVQQPWGWQGGWQQQQQQQQQWQRRSNSFFGFFR